MKNTFFFIGLSYLLYTFSTCAMQREENSDRKDDQRRTSVMAAAASSRSPADQLSPQERLQLIVEELKEKGHGQQQKEGTTERTERRLRQLRGFLDRASWGRDQQELFMLELQRGELLETIGRLLEGGRALLEERKKSSSPDGA